jgi:benzoylformate decarboxylase
MARAQPEVRRITGRKAFLELLVSEGVTHLFGNPGTTELAIMEVVPDFPQLTYVLGLQESIVLGMADGFARASGRLTACNLHCTPGLGHAMGALYTAHMSGSPIIVTAGQYEIGHGLQEPLLYEDLVSIARPLVKWAVEVTRIEDLPRIVRRAAKIAMAAPTGPVFISLPGSVLDQEAEIDLGQVTRVIASTRPDDGTLDAMVERLLAARAPLILAGREVAQGQAFAEVAELGLLLGAPIAQEPVAHNVRFPSDHPLCIGDPGRSQEKLRALFDQHDLLLSLGADVLKLSAYSTVEPMPPTLELLHVSLRSWELGKNYPAEIAVQADVRETLRALLPRLGARVTPDYAQQAAQRASAVRANNWSVRRETLRAHIEPLASQQPIDARVLMNTLSEVLPADVVLVEEALTSTPAFNALVALTEQRTYVGMASGGLGFCVPGAIGAALANPGRPVVAVLGDGSSLYAIQGLWTAAHFRLPITYVLANNQGYRIIKERLLAMRHSRRFVGMDLNDPAPDFVAIAQGFGVSARRLTDPRELAAALTQAIASRIPQLLDVVIDRGPL